jgi:predicted nucleic acid-binding protein
MALIVIDASVAVKFFLDEEYSATALSIRDSFIDGNETIAVPSIFAYEVLNALRYSNDFSSAELESAGSAILDYGFSVHEMNSTFGRNMANAAKRYNISIYDASYVALASMLRSTMYTSNKKLVEAVKLPFVKHIKDFA